MLDGQHWHILRPTRVPGEYQHGWQTYIGTGVLSGYIIAPFTNLSNRLELSSTLISAAILILATVSFGVQVALEVNLDG